MTVEKHERGACYVNYSGVASSHDSPDCVGSAQPSPSPSPVACTCSGDSETRFSPEKRRDWKLFNWRIGYQRPTVADNNRFPAHRRCRWIDRRATPPENYETKPKTVMKSMINYISLCCGSLKPEVFFLIVFQSFEGSLGIRSLSTEYDQIGFSCVKLPFASFLPSQQQQAHKSDPGARALFSH